MTPAQMKALHALAARRGLTHEDLRAIVGVASLRAATAAQAAAAIDRLQTDQPRPRKPRRGRRLPAGVIRPATAAQLALIRRLVADLVAAGEPRPKIDAWMQSRHRTREPLERAALSTVTAHQLIDALGGWYRKLTAAHGRAAASLPRSLDPSIPSPGDTEVPAHAAPAAP